MVMPVMSGRQMAEQLNAARRDTKFLFMTGYAEYPGSRAVEHLPGDLAEITVMQKPFSKRSLLLKVREMLTADSAAQLAGPARSE
jgi:FixJ family two-component response regulator